MSYVNPSFMDYLTLDTYAIVTKAQVWRVISWILVPPESLDIFTIIMLFFYFSIGMTMESTLGTYKYNVYIFRGILLTVLAAFLCLGVCYFFTKEETTYLLEFIYEKASAYTVYAFSTYYVNMSIFLAFAIVYPEMQVLLMFVIPVKVKWLGILDLVLLGYSFFVGNMFAKFSIGAALINVGIFYLSIRSLRHLKFSEIKRRAEFQHKVQKTKMLTKHKCAICGQTEDDDPNLEFRFCSKCNGNYEYCSRHLYTHEHVK